jgi:Glyoxalase/Bleomycin resistance protein/Dioxygenase superfamily
MGLCIHRRTRLKPLKEPTNTPGRGERRNLQRVWYDRAQPKLIHHAVFGVPDVAAGMRFYVDRLGFRVTDVARGRGIFGRCAGRQEHHNLLLFASDRPRFAHLSFGVNSIDELMAGANHMARKGWTSAVGLGRHRVSSTLFYSIQTPWGDEVEYSADADSVDDDWQPRLWDPDEANIAWVAALPLNASECRRSHSCDCAARIAASHRTICIT